MRSSPSILKSLGGLSVIVSTLFPFPIAIYRIGLGRTGRLRVHYHHNLKENAVFTDTKCFECSLSRRRDSGFIIYRELHQFVRKMCFRFLLTKHSADESDCTELFALQGQPLTQLSTRDFPNCLKVKGDLDAACRAKARRDVDMSMSIRVFTLILKLSGNQGRICSQGRNNLVFLLERSLGYISFNADIVKGMNNFDPVVLTVPSDQAALCFSALYCSFSLRDWMVNTPRSRGPR